MYKLISAFNAIIPWKHRFRWLLDSGWSCPDKTVAVSRYIYWYSPNGIGSFSSWALATMPPNKFRKLVTRTSVWFFERK